MDVDCFNSNILQWNDTALRFATLLYAVLDDSEECIGSGVKCPRGGTLVISVVVRGRASFKGTFFKQLRNYG